MTLVISTASSCVITLVPCLSFLLAELKEIENLAGSGVSDYRKLQVLEKIVNSVLRDRIFAVMGYFTPFIQLILCFVAIKLFHTPEVDIFRRVVFIWSYIGLLCLTLIVFSVAGNVIRISSKWILVCKGRSRSALTRRMCRSLSILKIQFGNNFVEPLTPLVLQEFCIQQTASLLILFN